MKTNLSISALGKAKDSYYAKSKESKTNYPLFLQDLSKEARQTQLILENLLPKTFKIMAPGTNNMENRTVNLKEYT